VSRGSGDLHRYIPPPRRLLAFPDATREAENAGSGRTRLEAALAGFQRQDLRMGQQARDGHDPEMCNAYPVDAVKAGALAPLVTEPIDLEKYHFFLQRYA
jgi:hypothetical protein